MKIKNLLLGLFMGLCACSSVLAESINSTITMTSATPGDYTGHYGVDHVRAGSFTDTFTLLPEMSGTVSASLVQISWTLSNEITFISAALNGVPLTLFQSVSPLGGILWTGQSNDLDLTAPIHFIVTGIVAPSYAAGRPAAASYGGNVNLRVAQVPEPASIALFGLGLFGVAAARRRKQ